MNKSSIAVEGEVENDSLIVTTVEEVEGFHTVRAILRGVVPSKRVYMRDAQSYCAILLDDNNRKPICRLRFNNLQRLRLGYFNVKKEEVIVDVEAIEDLFNFAEQIKMTVVSYLGNPSSTITAADSKEEARLVEPDAV